MIIKPDKVPKTKGDESQTIGEKTAIRDTKLKTGPKPGALSSYDQSVFRFVTVMNPLPDPSHRPLPVVYQGYPAIL